IKRHYGSELLRRDQSCLRMIRVGLPRGGVTAIGLIAPCRPTLARAASEQFDERPRRTCFDNVVLFIGFARMLAFARGQQIHLSPSRRERAGILAANTEQNQFGDIAEVKTDAAAIRAAVLPHLVPDDIG